MDSYRKRLLRAREMLPKTADAARARCAARYRLAQGLIVSLSLFPALLTPAVAETPESALAAPLGLSAPPHADVVDRSSGSPSAVQTFMMGRLDRLERDVRGANVVRPEGTFESITYRLPAGTEPVALVDHYARLLEGALVYRCSGRDCGRSTEWANALFGSALLYGPDARQAYAAWVRDDKLIAVYAIERGNRRVYSHLRVISPREGESPGLATIVPRQLHAQRWAVIPDLQPAADGSLSAQELSVLADLAAALGPDPTWVVCHLGGRDAPEALIAAASTCADTVAAALLKSEPRLPLKAFGVGPLAPRPMTGDSRVELVRPAGGRR